MSWQDVLRATPVAESPSQYSQYPQKCSPVEGFEDSEDIEKRDPPLNERVSDLSKQVQQAYYWDDLYAVLDAAQAAYDAGEVTGEEVEALAGHIADRSRRVPQPVGEKPEDQALDALLTECPVVRVRSRLLGEVVVWVADKATVAPDTEEVIYREAELRKLVGRSPAEMRAIHAVKRAVDGEVVVQ